MEALLVVDIQNDFAPSGALAVPDGDTIVPVVNQFQTLFDLVVATQDWHPEDHESFAVHHNKSPGEVIQLRGIEQILWPVHCVQHTPGADFIPSLDTARINHVLQKGINKRIDSYSGFFENDRQTATGLESYLRDLKVTDIYIVGLATDYCVKYTALDAQMLGFKTYVVEDATRGVNLNPGDVEKAIQEMKSKKIQIVQSVNLLQAAGDTGVTQA